MKDCCDDVKARLDALEEAIRNFKYSIVNHSSDAILNFGDPEKGTITIGPGETAKNAMRGTDVHPLFVASPNPGSELDYISKCKVYVERNGIPELRHSVENIDVMEYDITEYLAPVTGTIHVYATIGEEETAVWDVIKNGQHVTIGGPGQVEDGNSGEWPITPNSGYKIDSVTVRMGSNPVSNAWDGTKVSIPSVTGDVTIKVVTSAIEPTPGEFDVTPRYHRYTNTDTSNKTFTVTSSGSWTTSTSDTELIDITGGSGSASGSFDVKFKTVNNTGAVRSAQINVTSGGNTISVVAIQLPGAIENKLYTNHIGSSVSRDGQTVGTSISAEDSEQPLWGSVYTDNVAGVTSDSVEYTITKTTGPGTSNTETAIGTATDQLFEWPFKSTNSPKRTGKVIFSKDAQTIDLLGYGGTGTRDYSGTITAQTVSTAFCPVSLVTSHSEQLQAPGYISNIPNWITRDTVWDTFDGVVSQFEGKLKKMTMSIAENTNAEDRQADIKFGDTTYTIVQAGTNSDYVFARVLPTSTATPIVKATNAPMLLSTNAVKRNTRGRFFVYSGDALYSRNTATYIDDLTYFTIGGVDKKQEALDNGWVIPNGYNAYVDIPASEMTGDVEMKFSTSTYTGNAGASAITYSIGNNISILNKLCQYMGSSYGYHPVIKLKPYPYFKIESLTVNGTEVNPYTTYEGFDVDLTDGVYTITLTWKQDWNISASATIA